MEELVGALLIQSSRILLGRRAPDRQAYPGVWDMFGGHVEVGEGKTQALIRELREELGIEARQWTRIETLHIPDYLAPSHLLSLDLFLVTGWSGIPENLQPHEHSAIGWYTLEQALRLDLALPAYQGVFMRHLARV